MAEWLRCSVGDLCKAGLAELQTGPFGSQLHAHDYVDDGIPVVPTEAIRERKIDHRVLPKILRQKADELRRHWLLPDDILFARRGVQATGHVGYVRNEEKDFVCGTGAIRLRIQKDNGRISPEYLSHLFAAPTSIEWFKYHAIGATMPNLNEGIIKRFSLALPLLSEQLVISKFLSALDDKIDLNRRTNETLEAMARALFKDWFVDFGPTCAKAEGRSPYLAPELWDLFPAGLNDDDEPEGWKSSRFGDFAGLAYGKALKAEDRRAGTFPVYGSNGQVGWHDEALIRGPGVVVGRKGNPGTSQYVCTDFFCIDTTFYVVPRHSAWSPVFLWLLIDHLGLPALSADSAVPGLNREIAHGAQCVMPSEELAQAFGEIAAPLMALIYQNEEESCTLAKTRDLLLPRLMSGEIRVKEAEKIMAEVA